MENPRKMENPKQKWKIQKKMENPEKNGKSKKKWKIGKSKKKKQKVLCKFYQTKVKKIGKAKKKQKVLCKTLFRG